MRIDFIREYKQIDFGLQQTDDNATPPPLTRHEWDAGWFMGEQNLKHQPVILGKSENFNFIR